MAVCEVKIAEGLAGHLARLMKGGSSRKPMVTWNFSGTPGGGTWDSPGHSICLSAGVWSPCLHVLVCVPGQLGLSVDRSWLGVNWNAGSAVTSLQL